MSELNPLEKRLQHILSANKWQCNLCGIDMDPNSKWLTEEEKLNFLSPHIRKYHIQNGGADKHGTKRDDANYFSPDFDIKDENKLFDPRLIRRLSRIE